MFYHRRSPLTPILQDGAEGRIGGPAVIPPVSKSPPRDRQRVRDSAQVRSLFTAKFPLILRIIYPWIMIIIIVIIVIIWVRQLFVSQKSAFMAVIFSYFVKFKYRIWFQLDYFVTIIHFFTWNRKIQFDIQLLRVLVKYNITTL